jgi:hypothetical protein
MVPKFCMGSVLTKLNFAHISTISKEKEENVFKFFPFSPQKRMIRLHNKSANILYMLVYA